MGGGGILVYREIQALSRHCFVLTLFSFPSRYPHIACELLTSEVFAIVEQLSENEHLMALLWAFLDSAETLNPLIGR